MSPDSEPKYVVAVIGAGPAGLFAAKQLASQGVHVFLFNRDIKPGGLAEYGIYPDKHKMKEGLRVQFRQILDLPNVEYFGNITIGENGDLKLSDIRAMGFQAVLVTVGAQGTKWLGLPGEDLCGVYHAKDVVYHYNKLPPFSEKTYHIGNHVALVGAGNVMIDIARWLIHERKVEDVTAVVRRGPAEVKFTRAELEEVAANIDLEDLDAEIQRVSPFMLAVGQAPEKQREFFHEVAHKAAPSTSPTRFRLRFLMSPRRILGDDQGSVRGLEVEDNKLVLEGAETKAQGLGSLHVLDVDTVIFAIGDRVDHSFGLPVNGLEFVKHPQPRFPIEGNSYEAYDPAAGRAIEGVFVAGWSRKASAGLVGIARKDGTQGANAVLQYLRSSSLPPAPPPEVIRERILSLPKPVVTRADIRRLEQVENELARRYGLEEFKFATNSEMLSAMDLSPERFLEPSTGD
jgi:ferredoxin--NADP+ reductase